MAVPPDTIPPICFPLRHVFATLLILLVLHSTASPAAPRNQDSSLVTFNSSLNTVIPHCYTPSSPATPGIQSVDPTACRDALAVLIRTPNFSKRFRFSQNPRTMAVKVPIGWQMESDAACRIVVNCENDRDTAEFRYADVAHVARRIMDHCVDRPDPSGTYPLLKWGGVHDIGVETFYVAVARPRPSLREVDGANDTLVVGGGETA